MLGPTEWILIALIIIVLFGGKKIPELARGLGKGIREFKSAKNQIKDEIENNSDSDNK
jgi:sec-independent protein translocase protein TatA